MKQLTPMDSHFFYFEAPNQPMMIGSLWLCDQSTAPGGLVRHKDILQYVSDRLNTTSYFRRRLEKAPFQLDDPHARRIPLKSEKNQNGYRVKT
jgi:hypothetical protein